MGLQTASLITALFIPAYDWAIVNSLAQKLFRFDYKYWPLSNVRKTSLVLVAICLFVPFYLVEPPVPDNKLWLFLPVIFAMIGHVVVAIRDIFAQ